MHFLDCHKLNFLLILLVIFASLGVEPTQASLDPGDHGGLMDRIETIDVQETGTGTILVIRGNGFMPAVETRTISLPPRIVIDFLTDAPPFKSIYRQVSGPALNSFRVGHHAQSIRLVMDLAGPDVPKFSVALQDKKLLVSLITTTLDAAGNMASNAGPEMSDTEKKPVSGPLQVDAGLGSRVNKKQHKIESKLYEVDTPTAESSVNAEIVNANKKLLQVEVSAEQSDIGKYLNAVTAYHARNWSGTIEHLNQFIRTSAPNIYVEKAYFLLAKSFDRLHTEELYSRFNEIRGYYEEAIYRYPDSLYTPDAYLSIGDLFLRSKIYTEALGYYNLVIEMDEYTRATVSAGLQKAKILSIRDKKKEALEIYRWVVQNYPGLPETIQAKVGMAAIMFELNQFNDSLSILVKLEKRPEYAHEYPDILYYLGNIYFQLGSFSEARKHLFRFYNSCPEKQDSPLVLARIADAFREEGLKKEATLFYQIILKRYPQTEGALISMYRLAAMQETGDLTDTEELLPKLNILGEKFDLPRKIYEDVIQNAIDKNESTPLLQFALLKLSILDQREEKYEDGLSRLKTLLKKYPRSNLKREIEHTFNEMLLSILQKNLRVKKYKHVLNIYQAEKKMIEKLNSPEIFIAVARASLELNLMDLGIEMFNKAALNMPDEKKPSDLIFYVGREYFNRGEFTKALSHMDLLIDKRPADSFTSDAWMQKGKIFYSNGEFKSALRMFANALKHCSIPCRQTTIMIYNAKSLMHLGSTQDALQVLSDTVNLAKSCFDGRMQLYEEIGELYLQLGEPQEALSVIENAHDLEINESSRARLKMQMARCYEILNQQELYLAIYTEVANLSDPFWSNVAREKIDSINFKPIRSEKKD
jgi:tetratricopeptide (TPR) repeat protein